MKKMLQQMFMYYEWHAVKCYVNTWGLNILSADIRNMYVFKIFLKKDLFFLFEQLVS